MQAYLVCVPLWFLLVSESLCSVGNKALRYGNCYKPCNMSCHQEETVATFHARQPWSLYLMGWSCDEECRYQCMWNYTEYAVEKQWKVKQFYGKWPFVRWMGMQEPASTIFSFMNGVANFVWLRRLRKRVPKSAPLYKFWNIYAGVAINTWFWSTVYHARDFDITEKLDYYFATLLTIFAALSAFIRVLGPERYRTLMAGCIVLLSLYVLHVIFMTYVYFSYSYNMVAMVILGVTTSFTWLYWSYKVRKKQRYVWKCAFSIIVTNCLLFCFELNDFPPIWWVLDAHAIWHGLKVPLVLLWGSFVIDDLLYMHATQEKQLLPAGCTRNLLLDLYHQHVQQQQQQQQHQQQHVHVTVRHRTNGYGHHYH